MRKLVIGTLSCCVAFTSPLSAKVTVFPPLGLPKAVSDDIRLGGLNALATGLCRGQEITFDPSAIQRQDVDDDGVDDYIVDFEGLKCGETTPLCGSGGCQTDVLASKPDKSFSLAFSDLVRSITIKRTAGKPSLLANYHGSTCGGNGTDACPKTFVYNSETFKFEPAATSDAGPHSASSASGGDTIEDFSSNLAVYLVARKCASSGVVFNEASVSRMGELMKERFKNTPQKPKDLIWNKLSAFVENEQISVSDCKQNLTLAEYAFPQGVMEIKPSEPNPF